MIDALIGPSVRAPAAEEITQKTWTLFLPPVTLAATSDLSRNRFGPQQVQLCSTREPELERKHSLQRGCCPPVVRVTFAAPPGSDRTSWNVTRCPCGGHNSHAGDARPKQPAELADRLPGRISASAAATLRDENRKKPNKDQASFGHQKTPSAHSGLQRGSTFLCHVQ